MRVWLFISWLLCALLIHVELWAQPYVVSPTVPDFTDITAGCVVATYGSFTDPFANQGIVPDRHQVLTGQNWDEYTGKGLKVLPDGESKVVKLGNSQVGSEAEGITYHFMVDPAKAVLLLKFAVVFQDPSHDGIYQPRFVVRIMNKEGDLIDACAEYDVSARAGIDGFQTYDKLGIPIRWRDWTSVGLDMSAYAGQEVQVQFSTYDCALNAHFGYAYFTASCISHQLILENCKDDRFTLSAPGGFAAYRWQDGRTDASTVWTKGDEDMYLSCEVASVTGCRFTLSAFVSADNHELVAPEMYDTICQGEAYTKYNYNLPEQNEVGTFRHTNTYFNTTSCSGGNTSVLFLTVLQRYYPIVEELCPGESYVDNGFTYENPTPGVYRDTLSYPRAGHGCDSVVTLQLTVFPQINMVGNIQGDAHPCFGSTQIYSMSENWEDNSYTWQFPDGFYILTGQGTKQVTVQVMDVAQNGTVSLNVGKKGCAFGLTPFVVESYPAYWQTIVDTICSGADYREHGFNISRQDSAGVWDFTQYNKTIHGCDSIITLNLHVFETPEVSVRSSADIVCQGQPVKLEALGEGAISVPDTVNVGITIGDILCTDGSIVKTTKYKSSGKTAKGIVFYVNKEGTHGWAVSTLHQSTACRWSSLLVYISDLPNIGSSTIAILDTAGYFNTGTIRAAGNSNEYPAAYLVDYNNGWYIPAAGQLLRLYTYIPEVNAALDVVGGNKFVFNNSFNYWSSTAANNQFVWAMSYRGNITLWGKNPTGQIKLRAVCSF